MNWCFGATSLIASVDKIGVAVVFTFAAQSRIFRIRTGFAFRCRWSLLVNLTANNVCYGIITYVVRCVPASFLNILRNRAANFERHIARNLSEMTVFLVPSHENQNRFLAQMLSKMIILTRLTDHQTSGMLWWHLESSFCIRRTSFGSASLSHPLRHQMSPPYLEHYYQQYFVQQMGTYLFFCSGRDQRSIFCCWNRQDRRAHRPIAAIYKHRSKFEIRSVFSTNQCRHSCGWLKSRSFTACNLIPQFIVFIENEIFQLLCNFGNALAIRSRCLGGKTLVINLSKKKNCFRPAYFVFWTGDVITAQAAVIGIHHGYTNSNEYCERNVELKSTSFSFLCAKEAETIKLPKINLNAISIVLSEYKTKPNS